MALDPLDQPTPIDIILTAWRKSTRREFIEDALAFVLLGLTVIVIGLLMVGFGFNDKGGGL